jgi:hypothetical protein
MFDFVRKHATFANIVAILALTVALGGTSYAAAKLPKNSVGSKQIKPAAIKAKDMGLGSVTSPVVANGSLKAEDFASGVLNKLPKSTVQYEMAAVELADGAEASYDVHCPAGQVAVGGGARGDLTNSEGTILHSTRPIIATTNSGAPTDGGTFTGWRATFTNPAGGITTGIFPEVWVVCLSAP